MLQRSFRWCLTEIKKANIIMLSLKTVVGTSGDYADGGGSVCGEGEC